MPQIKSSCWEFCDFVRKGVIRCKFCHKSLSNNITRFKNHLLFKCNAPDNVKKRISAIPEKTIQAVQNVLLNTSAASASSSNAAGAPVKKKCILISDSNGQTQQIELLQDNVEIEDGRNHENKRFEPDAQSVLLVNDKKSTISADRLETLQLKFCRALFESRCRLNLFDANCWRDFFTDLCPDFFTPNVREIEGKFLDRVYNEIQGGINGLLIESNKLSILLDQSIDASGRNVLHVFVCSHKPFFYKTIIPSGAFQASTVETLIEQLIIDLGTSRVVALVAKSFDCIASPEFQQRFKPIIFYPCSAYQLRLMIIEMIQVAFFKTILEKALHLIASVRNDATVRARFRSLRNAHCRNLKLRKISIKNFFVEPFFCPATTYRNLLKVKSVLIALCDEPLSLDVEAQRTIQDDTFWNAAQTHCEFFAEISQVIRSVSTLTACLSDVVYLMNDLRQRLFSLLNEFEQTVESTSVTIVKDLFQSRYDQIVCDSAVLAYILHPRFALEGLRPQQIQEAELFLDQVLTHLNDQDKDAIITGYHAYFLKTNLFNNPLYWKYEIKDPISWWKRILKSKVHEKLAEFAIELLSIKPAVFNIDPADRHLHLPQDKQNQLNVIANHLRIESCENQLTGLDDYESGASDTDQQPNISETSYLLGLSQPTIAGQESFQYYLNISVDNQECQE